MAIMIGLIEDSRWEHDKWDILAEKCEKKVDLHHFYHPNEFLNQSTDFDILVVDRTIEWEGERIDIVTSGFLEKIREKHQGKLVYYSNATVFRDEKSYFDQVIKSKKISSLGLIL